MNRSASLLALSSLLLGAFLLLPAPTDAQPGVTTWRAIPVAESRAVGEQPRAADFLDELVREVALAAVEEVGEGKVAENEIWMTVIDARDPRDPRIGHYQGDAPVYPASVPNVAIMVTAYDQVATGQLEMTEALFDDIRAMVHRSSNPATSRVLDRVCNTAFGPALEGDALESYEWKKHTIHRHMTDLGLEDLFIINKTYGPGVPFYGRERAILGERAGDNFERSNMMSTNATARLFYMLWRRALVSPEASAEMLDHMVRTPDRNRTPFTVLAPEGATVYSKDGWTTICRHDAAIFELEEGGAIIVVAFSFVRDVERNYPPVITTAARSVLEALLSQPGELDNETADPDPTLADSQQEAAE